MQNLTILGATGSIGLSTLDVICRHPDKFNLYAVSGNTNVKAMAKICLEHKPQIAVMVEEAAACALKALVPSSVKVLSGKEALVEIAACTDVDTVMAAIVGGAGLEPTMAAAKSGKRILLANKEALVMSGELFLDEVCKSGATLLPVDSEHNAIYQALPAAVQKGGKLTDSGVHKILLTGSGGPFLTKPLNEFEAITPEMAVAHPNWDMGAKISVDSATMMNKGLEFIEARLLFNASFEQIDVIIHPQSIIHSMVSYNDGSVIAQMGQPDMRTPIAHTLAFPNRIDSGVTPLDFTQLADFSFQAPDLNRFPNLALALEASKCGQAATTILNAANEVSVAAFLSRQIGFNQIATINEGVLNKLAGESVASLDDILALDTMSRKYAATAVLEPLL